jgi:hypothetical protein
MVSTTGVCHLEDNPKKRKSVHKPSAPKTIKRRNLCLPANTIICSRCFMPSLTAQD